MKGSLGPNQFDQLGLFSRNLLMFYDRNRPASYQFTNYHWNSRKKVWFKEGLNKSEFQGLPSDVNLHDEPAGNKMREPDAYTMKINPGELRLKGNQSVAITINKHSYEWMIRYRDLKSLRFGDKPGR